MKIVLVNKFHWRKGGSETYYFALAEGLRSLGHEVHFFSMEDDRNEPCEDSDLFVSNRDYNGPTSLASKVSAAASIVYSNEAKRKFQELCERVHPDIVHMNLVHRQITLSILDAPYLKQNRIPILFTAHDYILVCPNYTMLDGSGRVCEACIDGRFSNCLKRKCVKGSTVKSGMALLEAEYLRLSRAYRKIDRVISPSRFLAHKMIEGGLASDRVIWMPNYLLDADAHAIDAVEPVKTSKPYLLYFGRLSEEKGIEVLIEAFSKAKANGIGFDLKVAGEGPLRQTLEEKSRHVCTSGAIEFLGFKTGDELRSLVKGAAFTVVPSTWYENMPYSVVESLAAGTPVIGSGIGGIPELIENGKTGLVASPGKVDDLRDCIEKGWNLFQDQATYSAMQSDCRDFGASHCSQARYMNALISLYQDLIELKKEKA